MADEPKPRTAAGGTARFLDFSIPIPPELGFAAGAPFVGSDQPAAMRIPADIAELLKPLADVATNAWRLKRRMTDAGGEPAADMQRLYRYVEAIHHGLAEMGIEIIDKTGKPYDDGMREKVVTFEPTPGLRRDEIVETIRPAIRWRERLLFAGEIVVGTPPAEPPPASTADEPTDNPQTPANEDATP